MRMKRGLEVGREILKLISKTRPHS